MRTSVIRQRFIDYFVERGHRHIPSSSLVPDTDPSLLFTNSGMVQFKNVFLGEETRDYSCACSAQLCLRAGGKHNDLENVGYTTRHHTLFEMLGNFSFGDYFKEQAISHAWTFLTDAKCGLGIDPRHLWVTVFGGGAVLGSKEPKVPKDEESYQQWSECFSAANFSAQEIKKRITRIRTTDNFWMMGESGPCGPCTEVFYHPDKGLERFVGEQEEHADECVEIWNLVFMEYNRSPEGGLKALPKPCVDTGMGLERVAAVMQGVAGNYETDLFLKLMAIVDKAVTAAGGKRASGTNGSAGVYSVAHRVLADHIRAAAFAVLDGVVPSNEGRGYVLRRIVRRALRHAHQLGATKNCLGAMVKPLAKCMERSDLTKNAAHIAKVLTAEEERFRITLSHGMSMLQSFLEEGADGSSPAVEGSLVFQMYDTYGFPPDLTADIAREYGATVDLPEFEKHMAQQRARSRKATSFRASASATTALSELGAGDTHFCGYTEMRATGTVLQLSCGDEDKTSPHLSAGEEGVLVLDKTPFYAEGGGQVGDAGALYRDDTPAFEVVYTTRVRDLIVHHGKSLVPIQRGDTLSAVVDEERRHAVMRNHSATHLLHASLIKVLGAHIKQKGSLVDADRLRFDFSHHEPVSAGDLKEIEDCVNAEILRNTEVEVALMSRAKAQERGAIALFGEKYDNEVRVLTMGGGFSVELCGGTHVQRTGDIGMLFLVEESGVAAGVRRIEAVTGNGARMHFNEHRQLLKQLSERLKCPPQDMDAKLETIQVRARRTDKELKKLHQVVASGGTQGGASSEIWEDARDIGGVKVLARKTMANDALVLRNTVDRCRDRLGDSVVFLVAEQEERLLLAAGVSDSLCGTISASVLMRQFAPRLGGNGGGKASFAQGSGVNLAMVDDVLSEIPDWVEERLR